jgi:probable rRNA maturation factor
MMRALLPGDKRELSVALVGEAEMRRLNSEFLGRDEPTDVLAFPLSGADVQGELNDERPGPEPLGDVVICVPVAERNAALRGAEPFEELELLLAHGLIHLLGGEHDSVAGAAEMEALERKLLGRSIIR